MILQYVYQLVNNFLGLDLQLLGFWHMIWRGLIVFLLGITIIKFNKRFMTQRTEFNFFLFIMLGSILATSITGNAPFFAVLGMVIILLILNLILIKLSFYFHSIEIIVKGEPLLLIKDGEFQWHAMRRCSISPDDLRMKLRLQYGSNDLENVKLAYMESNGDISFILKTK